MAKKKKRRKASKAGKTQKEEAPARKEQAAPAGEEPAGKKKKNKKKKQQLAPAKRERPNWPLTGLAAAGMLLTAYLVVASWVGEYPLYCQEGSTCDIVQSSRWGTLMFLPTAFWGFLTYAALAFIGLRVRNPQWHWKSAWVVSMVGLGYSIYLNSISYFVIEAMCFYCLASLSIMAAIFAVVALQRPKGLPDFKYPAWAGATLVVTALIVGGLHLHYSGVFDPAAGPEDPYLKGLAEHLSEEDAILYGAYW
jgi:uncharacterized membrane protein